MHSTLGKQAGSPTQAKPLSFFLSFSLSLFPSHAGKKEISDDKNTFFP
jgi:hypothetical protein